MIKKFTILFAILILLFSLVSCTSETEQEKSTSTETVSSEDYGKNVINSYQGTYTDNYRGGIYEDMVFYDVNSSAIESLAYSSSSQVMAIKFQESNWYTYYDVPSQVFSEFLHADSIGNHYHQYIEGVY